MKPGPHYYAKQFHRGHWHVISPLGIPIFDNDHYGQDKPVIFHDEDKARDCAERLNAEPPLE